MTVNGTVETHVVMHAQERVGVNVKVAKAIAMVIVWAIAKKPVKVVAKNHVAAVALILVQEVQNNRGNRKPYRVGNTIKCHSI